MLVLATQQDRQTDADQRLVAFRCAVDLVVTGAIDVDAASRNGVLVTSASRALLRLSPRWPSALRSTSPAACHVVTEYRAGRMPAAPWAYSSPARRSASSHGSIGARAAGLGRAFGMTVLVHDPQKTVAEPGIRQTGMDELLAASDFVVLLAVASDETRHLMNAARFAGMKPTAYFVNVSRPMLVDEEALASALRFGQIAGAALDVGSAAEMMPPVVLGRLPNVVATPISAA